MKSLWNVRALLVLTNLLVAVALSATELRAEEDGGDFGGTFNCCQEDTESNDFCCNGCCLILGTRCFSSKACSGPHQ